MVQDESFINRKGLIMLYRKRRNRIDFGRSSSIINKTEKSSKRRLIISIVTYIIELAIVIGIAHGITKYGLMVTTMSGESMEQTLNNGDSILVNKFAYKLGEPKRNDVVVYRQNSSEHSFMNIKRIIGLPGEKVLIKSGRIYINGKELLEDINVELMNTGGIAEEEIQLEGNEYFMLGDNRNNSQDSRFSNVGTVVRDDLIGKAWFRTKPFAAISSLNLKKNEDKGDE